MFLKLLNAHRMVGPDACIGLNVLIFLFVAELSGIVCCDILPETMEKKWEMSNDAIKWKKSLNFHLKFNLENFNSN